MHSGKNRREATLCAGLTVLVACQAEVGEDYTGEVMLSVEGSVVAGPDVDPDHVLALGFWGVEDNQVHLVPGETTGEFPSQFRFEVTTAPPEEALSTRLYPEPSVVGTLLVVPKNHPLKYPAFYHAPQFLNPGSEETYTVDLPHCTHTEDLLDEGDCVHENFSCQAHDCRLDFESGTPNMLDVEGHDTRPRQAINDDGEECTFTHHCNVAGCGRRVWCCDLPEAGPNEVVQVHDDGTRYATCQSNGFSGASELVELATYSQFVDFNTHIWYFADDHPADSEFPGDPAIEKGYTVYPPNPIVPGEYLAWLHCEADALETTFAEYADEYGERYNPQSNKWREDPAAERIISSRFDELLGECGDDPSMRPRKALHGSATGLEITLGPLEQ